jgi:predicted GIY-YIG superfamily endonuclease
VGGGRGAADGKAWCVYVLRCAGGTLYTGITNDLPARLLAHAQGRGARYTRGRRPVEIVYREEAPSRGDATRRESAIKRLPRGAKLALVGRRRGPEAAITP